MCFISFPESFRLVNVQKSLEGVYKLKEGKKIFEI
jgi:hypothetical protein